MLSNATAFAMFMIAPLLEIRNFLQIVRDSPLPTAIIRGTLAVTPVGIRAYLPKSRSSEGVAGPLGTVPAVFLNEPRMPVPSGSGTRSGFSDRGSEKSTAWRRMFENADITQSAKNGISMSHQIHFWFDNARFALKPLSETPEGVVVQWHWLKRSILKPLTYIRPNEDILHQAGVMDQNWGDNLAHRESGMRIRTGQTFLLRADKPEDKPSWDLQCVAALCGAADVTDDYYDYEDPDERCCDEAVAAKQRAILAEYEEGRDKAKVVNQEKGKGVDQGGTKQAKAPSNPDSKSSDGHGKPGDSDGGGAA
ncbi:hypothetical protein B0H67DRAFT_637783 [Lasiosphaeris hirsuta]|uniref:HNH nuclease domain-containing protein n=1 Tax=Lasiosphaeris hirsuta TaxID=260670 RepID=A0AA39ZXW1_9PEZI|nr:hypothetical protein B0H67DRAFT_637783 [Lasiosphaeris hirsuta]